MRLLLFMLCFITFGHITTYSQITNEQQLVILNINDCINCNTALQLYLEDNRLSDKTIVFQEDFQSDSLDIINLFNLKGDHYRVTFSDSLYNTYMGQSIKSKIIYLDAHDQVKYTQILQDYSSKPLKTNETVEPLCFNHVKNYILYKIFYPGYAVEERPQLKKFVIHSLNNDDKSLTLMADSSWMKDGYQTLLGKNYKEEYYEQMLTVNKFYPASQSQISGLDVLDSKAFVLYDVPIGKYDSVQDAQLLYKKHLIRVYDLNTQMHIRTLPIQEDALDKMNYNIGSVDIFAISQDTLYIAVNQSNSDSYQTVGVFKLVNDKYYSFVGFLNHLMPPIYNEMNLQQLSKEHIIKGDYVTLRHSDYVYDYTKDIKYKIPVTPEETENLSGMIKDIFDSSLKITKVYYSIVDIGDRGEYLDVLYKSPLKGFQMVTYEKGNAHPISTKAMSISPDFTFIRLHDTDKKILMNRNGDDCIEVQTY